MQTDRIKGYSDGVFAVAATLLALDIDLPRIKPHETLIESVFSQRWPQLLALAVGFLAISTVWMGHRRVVAEITREWQGILIVNTLLLLIVTTIVYPTGLLAEFLRDKERLADATFLFGANFALACALLALLAHVGRIPDDRPHGTGAWVTPWRLGTIVFLAGALIALAGLPAVGLVIFLIGELALLGFSDRLDQRPTTESA
jgi:uncharacterized membrane protein